MAEEIVHAPLPRRNAYPDLFGKQCQTRALAYEHGKWDCVLCRHCGDVLHLETGIAQVIGVIGPFPKRTQVGAPLYLNPWDQRQKRANLAEIDPLEITGGAELDYNWAVSAVVAAPQECMPRSGGNIALEIKGNPILDAHSRKLLEGIGIIGQGRHSRRDKIWPCLAQPNFLVFQSTFRNFFP
ncbi:MAG: hypothetical protein AAF998_07060 [Bacteroidota bacterium]